MRSLAYRNTVMVVFAFVFSFSIHIWNTRINIHEMADELTKNQSTMIRNSLSNFFGNVERLRSSIIAFKGINEKLNELMLDEIIIKFNDGSFYLNKKKFQKFNIELENDFENHFQFNNQEYRQLRIKLDSGEIWTYYNSSNIYKSLEEKLNKNRLYELGYLITIFMIILFFSITKDDFKRRYMNLSNQLNEGIFSTKKGYVITSSNDAFNKMFLIQNAVNTKLSDYLKEPEILDRLVIDGKLSTKTKAIIKKSTGESVCFPIQIDAIKNDTVTGEYIVDGVLKDITEQEIIQERKYNEWRMESMSSFTAGIAHDFNNILQILSDRLRLFSEICTDCFNEKQKKMINDAFGQVDIAKDVIQTLLRFTKQACVTKSHFDLYESFSKVTSLLQINMEKKGIQYQTSPFDDVVNVYGNEAQVLMAIQNLVLNSIDAVSDKNDKIIIAKIQVITINKPEIAVNGIIQTGKYACVSVSDSGGGISDDIMQKIFNPYFTTKGKHGSGIGLSVVMGCIQSMDGFVKVENKMSGASFSLYFPLVEKIEHAKKETPVYYVSQLKSVVVVDDESAITDNLRRILTNRFNLNVIEATNGLIALELIKQHNASPIDVLNPIKI